REVRSETAVPALRDLRRDAPPQVAVHTDAVRKHDRWPAAPLAVLDRAGAGHIDRPALAERFAYRHLIREWTPTRLGSRIVSPDVAPGWYPDPETQGKLRYWDGATWTQHTQDAGPGADGAAPPGGSGQAAVGSYDPTSMEGVPTHGRERIQQLRGGLFTSDLSVNEFLLVKEAGFDPLGLVVGSSIYHIGFQQSAWNQNQEMAVLSQAMYQARDLA